MMQQQNHAVTCASLVRTHSVRKTAPQGFVILLEAVASLGHSPFQANGSVDGMGGGF